MDNDRAVQNRYYTLRTIAAAVVAVLISFAVLFLGRHESWPQSSSIAFGSFLFCIPVLTPVFQPERAPSWPSRIGLGFIFAFVGGLAYAFVIDR